jgi:hypothetical protein
MSKDEIRNKMTQKKSKKIRVKKITLIRELITISNWKVKLN